MCYHVIMKIELLAPAGDINKLEIALLYGADAVYLGGTQFGLRAMSGNFTNEDIEKAVKMVHAQGKKVYVTLNIFARNDDFENIITYAKFLQSINVDAVIVSDLGVLSAVRENTNLDIHISTQANVLNKYTAEQYVKLGAKRIILARECNINEIREIANHLKGRAEIEVFVHGAICIAYSGRCMLSDYMNGQERSSNRGACTQPCRFKYNLVEEKRKEQYFEIQEDQNGTYIMNSRDLALINHLQGLADAGVTSFKIEGRTKTEYYVAGVVNAYRRAMDGEKFDYMQELRKIYHRPYTSGFVFHETNKPQSKQFTDSGAQQSTHKFVAIVLDNQNTIQHRNLFCVSDELEILSPTSSHNKTFIVEQITNKNGENIERAQRVQEILTIKCPHALHKGDMLRKKI